jgi:hypothetical protein
VLTFSQADAKLLNANIPYLVQFAYGAHGTQILFCGQNKTVKKTEFVAVAEDSYIFTGTTTEQVEIPNNYHYHRGKEQYFVHTDGLQMEPFRCFIVSTMTDSAPLSSGQILWYYVSDGSDSIGPCVKSHASMVCYDMMGRPLPKGSWRKGIIIADGVKILR